MAWGIVRIEQWLDLFEVLHHRRVHARRLAQGAVHFDAGRSGMEGGDALGQLIHARKRQALAGQDLIELGPIREAAHDHRRLDDIPFALESWDLRGAANQGYVEIESAAQGAIQAQFLMAKMDALIKVGKVQKAEIDGFFELVGPLTGQDDRGDMRLDQARGRILGLKLLEEGANEGAVRIKGGGHGGFT